MSTPQSEINMCAGVPLNNRYDHTLYFASAEEQLTYFRSKRLRTYREYTYLRRSWKLKVAATMEEARAWSYLFFRNGASAKYYYYFINQIEYINDATVELSLELDVLQTYLFEWQLRPCYVDREHSATDTPGTNTIDEGLEVGEYITALTEVCDLTSDLHVMTAASIDINDFYISAGENVDRVIATKYDNSFGALMVFASKLFDEEGSANMLGVTIDYMSQKGKTDALFTMWLYPGQLLETNFGTYEWTWAKYVEKSKDVGFGVSPAPTKINGYTPKNKKLLQYPYCFMYASNNAGGAAVYQYHYFKGSPTFSIKGNIGPDAIVKMIPVQYKGIALNYDESLIMGNYPLCTWNNDTYKMWLAQNQNQQNMSMAMSGLKIVGGAAAIIGGVMATGGTGGAAGAAGFAGVTTGASLIASGATEIGSQLAQRADKEIQPPQSRGTYSGSHNVARGIQNFYVHHKTIDAYHAEMIDNYFTMYGYACRRVKTPNINSRPAFNYVKTIGSNITGNFAMEDIKLINDIFDKGVTFWKNQDIGNYEIDNTP